MAATDTIALVILIIVLLIGGIIYIDENSAMAKERKLQNLEDTIKAMESFYGEGYYLQVGEKLISFNFFGEEGTYHIGPPYSIRYMGKVNEAFVFSRPGFLKNDDYYIPVQEGETVLELNNFRAIIISDGNNAKIRYEKNVPYEEIINDLNVRKQKLENEVQEWKKNMNTSQVEEKEQTN